MVISLKALGNVARDIFVSSCKALWFSYQNFGSQEIIEQFVKQGIFQQDNPITIS